MRWTLLLLALLVALPAVAQQDGRRWYLVTYFGAGRPPDFDGPYPSALDCDEARLSDLAAARRYLDEAAARPRENPFYVDRLRREVAQLERSMICELR